MLFHYFAVLLISFAGHANGYKHPYRDDRCTDERPYYLDKYRACVDCIVSTDCIDPPLFENEDWAYNGKVCYMGECKSTCPAGMYVTQEALVKDYFIALDAAITDKKAWQAFPPETKNG